MPITLKIPGKYINSLKLIANLHDSRLYLNSIFIEVHKTETFLVSTNGHALAAFRIESSQPATEPVHVIVPIEAFDNCKNTAKINGSNVTITIGDEFTRSVTVDVLGEVTQFNEIETEYPDWRRSFPVIVNNSPTQFDPFYLNIFSKISKLLFGKNGGGVAIGHNGSNAALVSVGHVDFAGCIASVSMKAGQLPQTPPVWVGR